MASTANHEAQSTGKFLGFGGVVDVPLSPAMVGHRACD